MTAKRFNFVGGYLYDGDEPVGHVEDIRFREDFLDLLNNLNEKARERSKALSKLQKENEQLKKDNFKAFALLGDIRALLRTNSYDTVIEKINKFEKEVLK